ncbi:M20/M25/M40 family metallo-hydrolase [Amylibacter sp. SFDW26]|uniref:M20 family peptidase n=1 Tax=Amylibacter sp. SFDW26 TaxID=2652722 RepID=UPI001261DCB6|nr:M20 family peptidase [Amylibacter sp. SFDW26]KAB7613413.1 M20/M25/M40 family metallo-hydrolase [Amylibacter sp. SFDW26]
MRKIFLRITGVLLLLVIGLSVVIGINTARYKPADHSNAEAFALGADLDQAVQNLSRAVQYQTISAKRDQIEFDGFLSFLETAYPVVHEKMEMVKLDADTPLFKWVGTDESLQPVLLAAHYDVVPIAPWSLDKWDYDPFSGAVEGGYVWGRGTLDDKGALIAILSAVEHLISTGFTPKRTIYLSFGGDEEVGGLGAKAVAEYLNENDIQLAWTLDEGSFVLDKIVPGLDVPVASINLSEKGYVTVKLVAEADGGHSALPPRVTTVGRIARAVSRLQDEPVSGGLDGVSAEFFDGLGRHFSLEKRALFANRWLFNPLLEAILSGSASTDAMLRTTTAPTMVTGSNKENVLASQATATINFRIHPRDTVDDIVSHVIDVIDDENIKVIVDRDAASEASPVASKTADGYRDIETSIVSVFGPIASVPGLTIAATDARHYAKASDAAYRINPFIVNSDDIARFHGINERLSIENLGRGIDFYGSLLSKQ